MKLTLVELALLLQGLGIDCFIEVGEKAITFRNKAEAAKAAHLTNRPDVEMISPPGGLKTNIRDWR